MGLGQLLSSLPQKADDWLCSNPTRPLPVYKQTSALPATSTLTREKVLPTLAQGGCADVATPGSWFQFWLAIHGRPWANKRPCFLRPRFGAAPEPASAHVKGRHLRVSTCRDSAGGRRGRGLVSSLINNRTTTSHCVLSPGTQTCGHKVRPACRGLWWGKAAPAHSPSTVLHHPGLSLTQIWHIRRLLPRRRPPVGDR